MPREKQKIKEKGEKMKCKSIKTKQAGITLIALVVTIVILLILAGVSISLVLGNNGLIARAKDAKTATEQGATNDETAMNNLSDEIDAILGSNGNGGSGDQSQTSLPSTEGSTPYLPSDEFSQVADTDLDTGLVIQDEDGNQYVWIEVPNDGTGPDYSEVTSSTDYTNIESALKAYTSVYRGTTTYDDVYYSDEVTGLTQSQYNELKQTMLKSVYENGGFYIGRYETGIAYEEGYRDYGTDTTTEHPITQTPVIQANAYPYNWVRCSQAQTIASSMNSGTYTSSLIFGVQWDLVLKYLETKGATQVELNSNSTSWGNYIDATYAITNAEAKYSTDLGATWNNAPYSKTSINTRVLLTTGADEARNSKQNICDLAGNVYEWTLEKTSDANHPCAFRGGSCYYGGSIYPASNRWYDIATYSNHNVGMRVALY